MSALLEVEGVSRRYRMPRRHLLAPRTVLTAVDNVSFSLAPGEILGIMGESGSGKSTLSRLVMGFERSDAGRVRFMGKDIAALPPKALAALRPNFQMVFQDPFASLDPRRKVGWSITEPLLSVAGLDEATRLRRATEVIELVGLNPADLDRLPHEFSGGQRQRIAIARAIATNPALLVADEPVASLDVSVQAQILNLLMDLSDRLGLAILFVSHDLAVISSLCDRVLVMQRGRVVEAGPIGEVFASPRHPYTQALLAAA